MSHPAIRSHTERALEVLDLRNRVAALELHNAGLAEHNRLLCELVRQWKTNVWLALLIAAAAVAVTVILEVTR